MKKLTKGTVLLFAVLLTSMMLFSSCDTPFDLGDATRIDKVLTLKDGGSIWIALRFGASHISVGISPDEDIHLTYYEYDRVRYDLMQSDDHFSIRQVINGAPPNVEIEDITILVPKGLSLGSFTAGTGSGGGITITDISANEISIVTGGSGNIIFSQLTAHDKIELLVDSGDIRGSIKGSRSDFTVSNNSSGSGKVTIEGGNSGGDGTKTLMVNTVSGNGNITFTE